MTEGTELHGRRFSVLGGARSGMSVAALLRAHGANVFLSDRAPAEAMTATVKELQRLGVTFEFGMNSTRVLETETIVVSPGIPSDAPLVKAAKERRIAVVSELEVASWFCVAPIIAVTGTNGKTTTTTLIGRMFTDARMPCVIAGNIGTAFSQVVHDVTAEGTAILEVSSFQLDNIRDFRPKVAAILNMTPDHLDRYEHSFDRYVAAKRRIFENQREGDILIYNEDDAMTRNAVRDHAPVGVTLLPFSTQQKLTQGAFVTNGCVTAVIGRASHEIIATDAISIRGEHNLANAMAATLAALVRNIPVASLRATLKNFRGVEHRLEFVRELDGVTYVNDSKATNVDSVWYALRSYSRPLVVLIGGRDKGNDYQKLVEPVREHVKAIVAIGESAEKVVEAFAALVPTARAGTMLEAVRAAQHIAAPGDIVLLSPACASFDWFDNYEHRGKVFKEIVLHLGHME